MTLTQIRAPYCFKENYIGAVPSPFIRKADKKLTKLINVPPCYLAQGASEEIIYN
jgi:hypothetical protein